MLGIIDLRPGPENNKVYDVKVAGCAITKYRNQPPKTALFLGSSRGQVTPIMVNIMRVTMTKVEVITSEQRGRRWSSADK